MKFGVSSGMVLAADSEGEIIVIEGNNKIKNGSKVNELKVFTAHINETIVLVAQYTEVCLMQLLLHKTYPIELIIKIVR